MEKKIESVMELVCDTCRYPHMEADQEACVERCESCPIEASLRSLVQYIIVRQGLEHRAALRREAALEAAEREFRAECNDRAISHRTKMEASQEAQRREAERQAAEAARKAAAARHKKELAEQEVKDCIGWYRFLVRIFVPLLTAAILLALANAGVIPFVLAAAIAIVACAYSIDTYVVKYFPFVKKPRTNK